METKSPSRPRWAFGRPYRESSARILICRVSLAVAWHRGRGVRCSHRRCRPSPFFSRARVPDFPFDVQALPIELTVGREIITHELLPIDKVELVDSPDAPSMMLPMRDPEWMFRVPRYKAGETGILAGVRGNSMAQFTLYMPITRDYSSYLSDHFFTSFTVRFIVVVRRRRCPPRRISPPLPSDLCDVLRVRYSRA